MVMSYTTMQINQLLIRLTILGARFVNAQKTILFRYHLVRLLLCYSQMIIETILLLDSLTAPVFTLYNSLCE